MGTYRAAIVGYGNIGKFVLEALEAAPDFEVAGVIRRNPEDVPLELSRYTVTDSITKLGKVDVAILATPTRKVESFAKETFMAALWICAVRWIARQKRTMRYRLSLPAGIREAIPLSVH